MKIKQEKENFKKITIELETKHEARVLQSLVGQVTGKLDNFRKVTDDIFDKLDSFNIKSYKNIFRDQTSLKDNNDYE